MASSRADDSVSDGYISVVTSDRQYITARRTSNGALAVSPAMSLESRRPLSDLFASGPLHDARGGAPVASVPASSLRDGSGVCHRSVLNSADYCWISRRYHSSCISSQQTVAASSDSAWRSGPLERTDGPSQSHLSSNPTIFGRCRNECRLPEVLYSFRLCTIL